MSASSRSKKIITLIFCSFLFSFSFNSYSKFDTAFLDGILKDGDSFVLKFGLKNILCCIKQRVTNISEDVTIIKNDISGTVIPELMSIESKLDCWIGPLAETIDSKIDQLGFDSECCLTVDSKLDEANIELGSIESKLDKWIGPIVETINSKIDQLGFDSECCLTVDSKLDEANIELGSIESKLDTWVGPLVETMDSKLDEANVELGSIESKLDKWIGPLVESMDSQLDVVESKIDEIQIDVDPINSKLDELDDKIDTVDSKLDNIEDQVITIDSLVDKIDIDVSFCATINSKVDVLDEKVDTVDSKIDVANIELVSIESKLDKWVGPLNETIDSKVDIANIELVSIESKLDKWVGPGVDTIGSQLDVLESKIDLIMNISCDDAFCSDLDCCKSVKTRYYDDYDCIMSKLDCWKGPDIESVESEIAMIAAKIIGGTVCEGGNLIVEEGLYTLQGNTTGYVLIDADDVILDLSGFTLRCDSDADAAIVIRAGHKNVEIINGKIMGKPDLSNNGILVAASCDLINIEGVKVYSCNNGISFEGLLGEEIRGCRVGDCVFKYCENGIALKHTIKSLIENCQASDCTSTGFYQEKCERNVCSECKALHIENEDKQNRAAGFTSLDGRENIFVECIAQDIRDAFKEGIGFLFVGDDSNSKVIDCIFHSEKIFFGSDL